MPDYEYLRENGERGWGPEKHETVEVESIERPPLLSSYCTCMWCGEVTEYKTYERVTISDGIKSRVVLRREGPKHTKTCVTLKPGWFDKAHLEDQLPSAKTLEKVG